MARCGGTDSVLRVTEIRDAVDAAIAGTQADAGWAELLRAGIATGQTLDFTPRARDYRVISRLNRFSHVPSLWLATTILITANLGAFSPTDCDAAIEQQTAVSTVVPTPAAPDESVVTLTTGSSDLAPTAYPASASRRRGG